LWLAIIGSLIDSKRPKGVGSDLTTLASLFELLVIASLSEEDRSNQVWEGLLLVGYEGWCHLHFVARICHYL